MGDEFGNDELAQGVPLSHRLPPFLQRLSLKKTLMESVAVMLGSAWLLHERKRRKARHRR